MTHSPRTIVITLLLCGLMSATVLAAPRHQMLFDSGKEGYPRYRIPSLIVTKSGALLAICEGRKDGGGLTGNIDIVMKRSEDGGKTWSKLQRIADDGDNTLGNPCPVVDRITGIIWLPLSRSFGGDLEKEIVAGTSRETTRVLLTSSTDDGKTWAPLQDITKATKRPDWTWYGPGPGTGIQLNNGRLLIPAYHANAKDGVYRSHTIFSDDHGKTWQHSPAIGNDCSECYVSERKNGEIYLNARTVKGKELRTVATSKDHGSTWSKAKFEQQLYDSHCQGCVIALQKPERKGKSIWLFSNPAGPGRRKLTVRASFDEGRTWPVARRLREGDSQYSSLAQLPDGSIGCLYDCWQDGNYRLLFVRFSLDWVLGSVSKQ